jgi:hypothetical protein
MPSGARAGVTGLPARFDIALLRVAGQAWKIET